MAERLTDALARRSSAADRPQLFFLDIEVKGFGLRITNNGAKSFVLDYRLGGRQRRITIGSYPDWSVQAARKEAGDLKKLVDKGEDPMGERTPSAPRQPWTTFGDATRKTTCRVRPTALRWMSGSCGKN